MSMVLECRTVLILDNILMKNPAARHRPPSRTGSKYGHLHPRGSKPPNQPGSTRSINNDGVMSEWAPETRAMGRRKASKDGEIPGLGVREPSWIDEAGGSGSEGGNARVGDTSSTTVTGPHGYPVTLI